VFDEETFLSDEEAAKLGPELSPNNDVGVTRPASARLQPRALATPGSKPSWKRLRYVKRARNVVASLHSLHRAKAALSHTAHVLLAVFVYPFFPVAVIIRISSLEHRAMLLRQVPYNTISKLKQRIPSHQSVGYPHTKMK
jgi:hypothetical protein